MASEAATKESKGSVFSRTANFTTKRALRATEKVMQKLGKSAPTRDETFAEFVSNFSKQQMMASSLNKEVKKYMDALRSMAAASKNLGDCFHDLYEPEWAGQADVSQLLSELCQCHSDLLETLQLQLSDPVMAYFSHFSDIKTKISKQERKVVDYDRRKRHLEQLRKEKQTKSKVNDAKLAQAETEFEEARHVYDSLTNELYEELPTFYDSRIPFYAAIFQSLYVAEAAFHSSVATLKTQLNDLMDVAALDAASHVHSTRKPRVQRHPVTALAMSLEDDTGEHEEEQAVAEHSEDAYHDLGNTEEQESSTAEVEEKQEPSKDVVEEEQKSSKDTVKENQKASKDTIEEKSEESEKKVKPVIPKRRDSVKKTAELAKMAGPVRPAPPHPEVIPKSSDLQSELPPAEKGDQREELTPKVTHEPSKPQSLLSRSPAINDQGDVNSNSDKDHKDGDDVSHESSYDDLSVNVLYQVEVTHQYLAQDSDELSLEKGEKIDVIPFDNPDEQDAGWLAGIKVSDGQKGVFPENFTKRID